MTGMTLVVRSSQKGRAHNGANISNARDPTFTVTYRSLLMKSPFATLLALALSAILATPLAASAAGAHSHGHDQGHDSGQSATANPKLELNAGKKWSTDEPLRQAMSAIHTAVSQTLPAAHAGKAKPADYNAFGQAVTTQISYMVEKCKLAPQADAQLHIILAEVMAGVETAEGKQGEKKRASGVVKVAKAANAYGEHFDHAGWVAVKLPH